MSYAYDSTTRTLTITGPSGYAEVMASELPLDNILVLKDRSQPRVDSFVIGDCTVHAVYQKEGVLIPGYEEDEVTIRNDRTYQSSAPPADFPLLPNLLEAHFTGILLQPPRFPLPPTCKLYVYLQGRLRGNPPSNAHVRQYDPHLMDSLDEAFPWFEMPGLAILQLRNFKASTTAPPPCESLEHLFLWDSNSFTLPAGSKLPENLKTFVLGHSDHTDYPADNNGSKAGQLFAALPSHSLETLILVPDRSGSCGGYPTPQLDSLRDFEHLTTLCVPRWFLDEDTEFFEFVPDDIETLVLLLDDWDREEPGLPGDLKSYLDIMQDSLRKLVLMRSPMAEKSSDPNEDEILKKLCNTYGTELTLAWEHETLTGIDVVFREELEEGCIHPHFQLEEYRQGPYLGHQLRLTFSKQPA